MRFGWRFDEFVPGQAYQALGVQGADNSDNACCKDCVLLRIFSMFQMFDLGNLGNFFQTSFLEYHGSLCMNFFGFSFMVSGVFPSTSPTNHLSTLPALVRSSGYSGQHGPRASRFGSQRLGPGSAPRWSPRGQPSRSGTEGHAKMARDFSWIMDGFTSTKWVPNQRWLARSDPNEESTKNKP